MHFTHNSTPHYTPNIPFTVFQLMNPSPTFLITFTLLLALDATSQKTTSNLIPNPSFEEYSDDPTGWFYSGHDFSRVAMYWTSPTGASPDIYGPKVHVPKVGPKLDSVKFDHSQAHRTQASLSMVAITANLIAGNISKSNFQNLWCLASDTDFPAKWPTSKNQSWSAISVFGLARWNWRKLRPNHYIVTLSFNWTGLFHRTESGIDGQTSLLQRNLAGTCSLEFSIG